VMVRCSLEVAFARHWTSVNGLPGIDLTAPQSWRTGTEPPSLEYSQLLTCHGIDRKATTTVLATRNSVSSPKSAATSMDLEVLPTAGEWTGAVQPHEMSVTPTRNGTPTLRGDSHVSTRTHESPDQLAGIWDGADALTRFARAPSLLAQTRIRTNDHVRSPHDGNVLAGRNTVLDPGVSAT
jgi:hypothetical protein